MRISSNKGNQHRGMGVKIDIGKNPEGLYVASVPSQNITSTPFVNQEHAIREVKQAVQDKFNHGGKEIKQKFVG